MITSVYECKLAKGPLNATVRVPGSKSITNRALIAAVLGDGNSILEGMLFSEDTRLMVEALGVLGARITVDEERCAAEVSGLGGRFAVDEAKLYCGNAGTVMRFCAALAALGNGRFVLDGAPRMRRRPIGPLTEALRHLGAGVEFIEDEGFPPIAVRARGLRGGTVTFGAVESSQFVSALLLSTPYASADVFIEVDGALPSAPYVRMTTHVMEEFGVDVLDAEVEGGRRLIVPAPQRYLGRTFRIEPDATNATYFWSAAAVAGGSVAVEGLGSGSVQGDVGFVDVLERMGCAVERSAERIAVCGPRPGQKLKGVDVDLNAMPDTVQTLAVLALFADGETVIRNVANLRVKETDRIAALTTELRKLGAEVDELADGLRIRPPRQVLLASIETYDDHRMAMSFAPAGLACPGMTIRDPQCCAKTFANFFEVFEGMRASK